MITKQDILDRASEWRLRPEVVEKDYVLGWLLWGLGRHAIVQAMWIFKGGTCLKKCYFETYRFSEDLDFTLRPEAPYSRDELLTVMRETALVAAEESGIDIPVDTIIVDEKRDKQGRPTFKVRVGYRGPLAFPGEPRRVLFDLTAHEPILAEPVVIPVFHPYPDTLTDPANIRAYSLEELLAEKTRALLERTRPRDLYDVVFIFNNHANILDLDRTRELFRGKCQAKGLEVPTTAQLVTHVRDTEELKSEWDNMLRHQLPQLPPIDSLLEGVEEALRWIDVTTQIPAVVLSQAHGTRDLHLVAPAGIHYWGRGAGVEAIRFAGSNRLQVRFFYHDRDRQVEPYSLRRSTTGNILLYAWEARSTHIKAFNMADIRDIRPTDIPFTPRYRIEFTSGGFAPIPPSTVPTRSSVKPLRRAKSTSSYIFRCPMCGKEFRRSRNDPTLRKHDAPGGWACSGRRGILARMM